MTMSVLIQSTKRGVFDDETIVRYRGEGESFAVVGYPPPPHIAPGCVVDLDELRELESLHRTTEEIIA